MEEKPTYRDNTVNTPDLSCIILTCNSYENKYGCIEHTILCLLNQKFINKEIIIVDNSNNSKNRKSLLDFLETLEVYIPVIEVNTSISAARNIGAQVAKSNVFVFIDDDTLVLNEDALEKIFYKSKIHAYGYGAKRYWTKNEEWFAVHSNKIKENIKNRNYSFLIENMTEPDPEIRQKSTTKYLTRSFIGNFGYINKDAFNQIQGFPLSFQGYGLEDDAMSFLCFLNFGFPASLIEFDLIHITHTISSSSYKSYEQNKNVYQDLLRNYGYSNFHIGDLLYPENSQNRPILEPLHQS